MLELAIWMYHIGNPDPVVRVITDVATSLVILWGVVNHYAKKESDKEFMDVYNEMRNWKAVAHYDRLRRVIEDIYGVGAMVERVKGEEPVFGEPLFKKDF